VDGQPANSIENSLEAMMKERSLQQSGESEPNQEQIKAAPFQTESFIADLNEDGNLLRTSGGEEVYQSTDISLLIAHMGMSGQVS
jgi:hypothetical protein